MGFSKLRLDPFLAALATAVALATLIPAKGPAAPILGWVCDGAIALLFFLHGARLSAEDIAGGIGAWRVHGLVLAASFVMFPLLGLGLGLVGKGWIDPAILAGVLFLCLLPSTVQSSIAFTAIARGNVAAAVCSASLSNVVGIFFTPLAAGLLLHTASGGFSLSALGAIALQLLLPFAAGHLSRPITRGFIARHRKITALTDRGTIVLVVYAAFSAAVNEGLWQRYSLADLAVTLLLDAAILALALLTTRWGARRAKLSTADETVVVFCGSKKSLASGVPMAGVLFSPVILVTMILPLMLFHQMQLMVSAVLARRYGERAAAAEAAEKAARCATNAHPDAFS